MAEKQEQTGTDTAGCAVGERERGWVDENPPEEPVEVPQSLWDAAQWDWLSWMRVAEGKQLAATGFRDFHWVDASAVVADALFNEGGPDWIGKPPPPGKWDARVFPDGGGKAVVVVVRKSTERMTDIYRLVSDSNSGDDVPMFLEPAAHLLAAGIRAGGIGDVLLPHSGYSLKFHDRVDKSGSEAYESKPFEPSAPDWDLQTPDNGWRAYIHKPTPPAGGTRDITFGGERYYHQPADRVELWVERDLPEYPGGAPKEVYVLVYDGPAVLSEYHTFPLGDTEKRVEHINKEGLSGIHEGGMRFVLWPLFGKERKACYYDKETGKVKPFTSPATEPEPEVDDEF